MEMQPVTLVTIITEAALKETLCELALQLGATGYTVTPCAGSGERGTRRGLTDVDVNVRIEILARQPVAETIVAKVAQHYAPDYALVLFMQTVIALALNRSF